MSCKFGRPGTLFFRIPNTRYILPIVIENENEILKKKGRGELETWLDTFKVTHALADRDDAMHWRVPQVSHQNYSLEDAYWASFITYDAQDVWKDGGYSKTSYRRFCTVLENMEIIGPELPPDEPIPTVDLVAVEDRARAEAVDLAAADSSDDDRSSRASRRGGTRDSRSNRHSSSHDAQRPHLDAGSHHDCHRRPPRGRSPLRHHPGDFDFDGHFCLGF
jgi:hypothetical protein